MTIEDSFRAKFFFPWCLRQSTLSQITSLTFRGACFCYSWILFGIGDLDN